MVWLFAEGCTLKVFSTTPPRPIDTLKVEMAGAALGVDHVKVTLLVLPTRVTVGGDASAGAGLSVGGTNTLLMPGMRGGTSPRDWMMLLIQVRLSSRK